MDGGGGVERLRLRRAGAGRPAQQARPAGDPEDEEMAGGAAAAAAAAAAHPALPYERPGGPQAGGLRVKG